MYYHSITFTKPEAAEAFARLAMVRSIVRMDSVEGMTVHMSSDDQLSDRHRAWIKAEVVSFGIASAWKFNWTEKPDSERIG